MTLKQLLTDRTWAEIIEVNNRYPNFANYVIKRYGNYESRYDADVFRNLWISLILNNQAELSFAETLTAETNMKLSPDKLGDVVKTVSTNTHARSGENLNSYKGYDVEGDYSKFKSSGNTTNDNNTTSTAINYFSYLSAINHSSFRDTWKHITRQILSLCITIYPIIN